MAQRKGQGGSSGAGAGNARGSMGGGGTGGDSGGSSSTIAGDWGGFNLGRMKAQGLVDLSPKSKTNKQIGKGLTQGTKKETVGSPTLPTVPSRTRTLNFPRPPTAEELGIMGGMIGGVLGGSPVGVVKGISDALSSDTAFQGAVSQGDQSLDVKGTPGAKDVGLNITEEEKKRRKAQAQATLLGSSGPVSGPLGSPTTVVPI